MAHRITGTEAPDDRIKRFPKVWRGNLEDGKRKEFRRLLTTLDANIRAFGAAVR